MPAYDFRCTSCRHTFEVTRPAGEASVPECPVCGAATKRIFTPVGVHFKGSGFYTTDSKAKNAAAKPAAESKPTAETPACPSAGESGGCAGCPAAKASGE
jgi:putative FmdB family regulatory protein